MPASSKKENKKKRVTISIYALVTRFSLMPLRFYNLFNSSRALFTISAADSSIKRSI